MTDALDARREIDICQGRTTGEKVEGQIENALGNTDGRETCTVLKSTRTDLRHGAGNGDGGHRGTVLERATVDLFHIIGHTVFGELVRDLDITRVEILSCNHLGFVVLGIQCVVDAIDDGLGGFLGGFGCLGYLPGFQHRAAHKCENHDPCFLSVVHILVNFMFETFLQK